MSTAMYSSGKIQNAPNRWLWAAVGALAATTVALGVALVQMRPAPPAQAVAMPALTTPAQTPAASTPKEPAALVKQSQVAVKNATTKHVAHLAPPAPVTARSAIDSQPVAVATPMPSPPPRVVCANCATVTAVTPVQRDGAGSGTGVVAGALLGGLLGNQVGGGTGKTAATVLGAVGGGWAGNTVEKRMKKETVYHIDLRMEDGSTQRLEHNSPLSVGAHVTVNGGIINQ